MWSIQAPRTTLTYNCCWATCKHPLRNKLSGIRRRSWDWNCRMVEERVRRLQALQWCKTVQTHLHFCRKWSYAQASLLDKVLLHADLSDIWRLICDRHFWQDAGARENDPGLTWLASSPFIPCIIKLQSNVEGTIDAQRTKPSCMKPLASKEMGCDWRADDLLEGAFRNEAENVL